MTRVWIDTQAEQFRYFTVQPIILASVMHDAGPCPFNHDQKSKKYIPPEQCARLHQMKQDIATTLRIASEMPMAVYAIRKSSSG